MSTVLHGYGWTYIRLSGAINEDNRLSDLKSDSDGGPLFIDLAEVERINSCGVRDWVNWMEKIQYHCNDIRLLDCSPTIVAQLNLVSNFAKTASVVSLKAPYYCEDCDLEHCVSVDASTLGSMGPLKAPGVKCPSCATVMSFDDIEESFFGFLSTVSIKPLTEQMAIAVDEAKRSLDDKTQSPLSEDNVTVTPHPPIQTPEADLWDSNPEPTTAQEITNQHGRVLSKTDIAFYFAIGSLTAVLLVILYYIIVP